MLLFCKTSKKFPWLGISKSYSPGRLRNFGATCDREYFNIVKTEDGLSQFFTEIGQQFSHNSSDFQQKSKISIP